MVCGRVVEDGGECAAEFGNVGAAVMPERRSIRQFGEAQHFFDATVAVGGHNDNAAAQLASDCFGQTQDNVVMKFALDPVGNQLVATIASGQLVEQSSEDEMAGKIRGRDSHSANTIAAGSRTSMRAQKYVVKNASDSPLAAENHPNQVATAARTARSPAPCESHPSSPYGLRRRSPSASRRGADDRAARFTNVSSP